MIIPIYFTNKTVILPYENLSFIVNEKVKNEIGVIAIETDIVQIEMFQENLNKEQVYGTLVKVINSEKVILLNNEKSNSAYKYQIIGIKRFKVQKFIDENNHFKGQIEYIDDNLTSQQNEKLRTDVDFKILEALFNQFQNSQQLSKKIKNQITNSFKDNNCVKKLFTMVSVLPMSFEQKNFFLSINNNDERIKFIREFLKNFLYQMDNNMQLSNISGLDFESESQIKKAFKIFKKHEENLPKQVRKIILRILNKIKNLNQDTNKDIEIKYLETLVKIPWNIYSNEEINIQQCKQILKNSHFGLQDVKQRILEFLAVQKLSQKKGDIICFVGPPGVGKTTLAKSISNALNRKFYKISLGGVNDESVLRGHRRTYVGSYHGEIINALINTKTMNPVILIDEIDKLNKSNRGDPSHVLLEVLDNSQNQQFMDHYLNIPIDLSQCIFIATANNLSHINKVLRDRIEFIKIQGYTENEKINIFKNHFLQQEIIKLGLQKNCIEIQDDIIQFIIRNYTQEAGVRELQRKFQRILRNQVILYLNQNQPQNFFRKIDQQIITDILGHKKYNQNLRFNQIPGVVQGLAQSDYGGSVMIIEISSCRQNNGFKMTGNLGKVLKESIELCFSYIKCFCINNPKVKIYDEFNLLDNFEFLNKNTFYVHFNENGIPKDGPSAGITLCAAIFSLIFNQSIKKNFALTGEITLTGMVLPVGGIQNKILAAQQRQIQNIILPQDNKQDIQEIEKKRLIKNMNFYYIENVIEILEILFTPIERNILLNIKPKL